MLRIDVIVTAAKPLPPGRGGGAIDRAAGHALRAPGARLGGGAPGNAGMHRVWPSRQLDGEAGTSISSRFVGSALGSTRFALSVTNSIRAPWSMRAETE